MPVWLSFFNSKSCCIGMFISWYNNSFLQQWMKTSVDITNSEHEYICDTVIDRHSFERQTILSLNMAFYV